MDQLNDYADDRLIIGCIYCGGPPETRDHVPSRVLLDEPLPENLPVVGACYLCNQGFSLDEEYFACLESVMVGSTDPAAIRRPKIARILRRAPALRAQIDATRIIDHEGTRFAIEPDRVRSVLKKLARGHAAYELSQLCRDEPARVWWRPFALMTAEQREEYEASQVLGPIGEIGSRQTQRELVMQVSLAGRKGETRTVGLLVNDWLEVQDGRYRYLAEERHDEIVIKMVIGEYLACEVSWER